MKIPYQGKIYKSIADLCRENDWDDADFRRFRLRNIKVPIEQLAERYAIYRLSQWHYNGRYWSTQRKACEDLGINYKDYQNWKQRTGKNDKARALGEYLDYLEQKLIPAFGKLYTSIREACRDNNVNYERFMQYRQTECMEESLEEQIIAFKAKETKNDEFSFCGKRFNHYSKVCVYKGWNARKFTTWRHNNKDRNYGISKAEICSRYEAYLASCNAQNTSPLPPPPEKTEIPYHIRLYGGLNTQKQSIKDIVTTVLYHTENG